MRDCPGDVQLHQLLEDAASDAEQAPLEEHLESCDACQQRLERMAAGDEDFAVVTDVASNRYLAEPALAQVKREARSFSRDANLESDHGSFTDEDLILEFLEPAEESECLGRLAHYDVLEVLGRGGMGVVLRAVDRKLQRVVAIKVMAPLLAASPRAKKWFRREAQSAAALCHDHIVTIHSVEEAQGLPFIVMQCVEGQSLQQRLERDGPLELRETLRIAHETALGLAAAHAHGLIHRDIKPANILLEADSKRVKIADFGLAKAVDAGGTGTGIVAGTPHYMAPEQAAGGPVDHRADLYALGGVLYAMCSGKEPPLGEPSEETTCDLPDWLGEIISRLRAQRPEDRFQSAEALAEVLAGHLSDPELAIRPRRQPSRRAILVSASAGVAALAAIWIVKDWLQQKPDIRPPLAQHEVRRFVGHNMWLACLAVSPDGRRALSGGADKTVRLWDTETGEQLFRLEGH